MSKKNKRRKPHNDNYYAARAKIAANLIEQINQEHVDAKHFREAAQQIFDYEGHVYEYGEIRSAPSSTAKVAMRVQPIQGLPDPIQGRLMRGNMCQLHSAFDCYMCSLSPGPCHGSSPVYSGAAAVGFNTTRCGTYATTGVHSMGCPRIITHHGAAVSYIAHELAQQVTRGVTFVVTKEGKYVPVWVHESPAEDRFIMNEALCYHAGLPHQVALAAMQAIPAEYGKCRTSKDLARWMVDGEMYVQHPATVGQPTRIINLADPSPDAVTKAQVDAYMSKPGTYPDMNHWINEAIEAQLRQQEDALLNGSVPVLGIDPGRLTGYSVGPIKVEQETSESTNTTFFRVSQEWRLP